MGFNQVVYHWLNDDDFVHAFAMNAHAHAPVEYVVDLFFILTVFTVHSISLHIYLKIIGQRYRPKIHICTPRSNQSWCTTNYNYLSEGKKTSRIESEEIGKIWFSLIWFDSSQIVFNAFLCKVVRLFAELVNCIFWFTQFIFEFSVALFVFSFLALALFHCCLSFSVNRTNFVFNSSYGYIYSNETKRGHTHTHTNHLCVSALKSMHHLMLTFIWMYVIKHYDKTGVCLLTKWKK